MRLILGVAAGAILWAVGVLQDGADGAVFRMFFGLVAATIFAALLWFLGIPLRLRLFAGFWWQLSPLLLVAIVAGVVLLVFADRLGLMHDEIDPNTGLTIRVMNPHWLLVASYFLVVFPIVNWPKKPALRVPDSVKQK